MPERAQIFYQRCVKENVFDPKVVAHAGLRVKVTGGVLINELLAEREVIFLGDIRRGKERCIEARRIVLAGFIGIDNADEMVIAWIALLDEEAIVCEKCLIDRLEKGLVRIEAVHFPRCVCDHRGLRERACALDAPAKEVEDPRRPINDVRHHTVLELLGKEGAQFSSRGFGIEACQNDSVEARVPEPLVGIVLPGRKRVLVAARRAPVFLKKFPRLTNDIHQPSIAGWVYRRMSPDILVDTHKPRRRAGFVRGYTRRLQTAIAVEEFPASAREQVEESELGFRRSS